MQKNMIKGYRNAIGLSQNEMAKHLGISSNSYSEKERGNRKFTINEVEAYCNVLKSKGIEINIQDIFFNS